MKNTIIVSLLVLVNMYGAGQICSPSLDPAFGTAGITVGSTSNNNNPYSNNIIIQPDNKIVQIGRIFDGAYRFAVIRYKSDGSFDSTFGVNGKAITQIGSTDSYPNNGILLPDGKIIVVGSAYNVNNMDFAIVKYNSDGSLDNSFGSGGIVLTAVGLSYDFANGIAIQADGKIVVTGGSADTSSVTAFATVRYNSNGSIDNTFGTNGKIVSHLGHFITFLGNVFYGVYSFESANAVIIQSDGKIVVAGNSYTRTGCYDYYGSVYCNPAFAMVRYNTNGSTDSTFGKNGKVVDSVSLLYLSAAIKQADGKILVTGTGNTSSIITQRYDINGNPDSSFGINGIVATTIGGTNNYSYSSSIFQQPDGKILISGSVYINNANDIAIVRLTANGSLDNSFNTNGTAVFHIGQQGSNDGGSSVALQSNKIVVGTNSFYYGPNSTTNNFRIGVMRLLDNGSTISPVITPTGPVTFCQGSVVTLTASEAGTVRWYLNNVLVAGATSATFNPTTSGVYTVSVSNINGCGVSPPVIVTVKTNPPKPTLTYDGNPYRFSTTAGYSGYQWYFNNTIIAGASGNTFTPSQTGLYKVQVTNADNCSNTSDVFNLVALATSDIMVGDVMLRYYPNPANDAFYVDIPQPTNKKLIIELYDLNGRLLQKQSLNQSHNKISVSSLPAGLYQLVIYNVKEKAVRKIIVVK